MRLSRPTVATGLRGVPAAARMAEAVPVVVGGPASTAACPGGGEVVGLDPQGDDVLSVRSGPGGGAYGEVDRIHTGQRVKICDMSGPWFAVLYDPSGDTDICDVDRPWTVRRAYAGRCRQGWVYSRYVDVRPR